MSLIDSLARDTGLSLRDVRRIVATAPKRYKSYPIPKRSGGERIIAQPAFEVKAIQKLIATRVLSEFPVHESAYAYVRGRSIRHNALRHAKSSFILKLDFKDFFHSIRPVDLERVLLTRDIPLASRADFEVIYQSTFWGRGATLPLCLSIGAPSSPLISNIVMFEFDRKAFDLSIELGLTYTRYADDLTISSDVGQSALLTFERRLQSLTERSPMDLVFNQAKRGLYGRGEKRMVTGLVITPDGKISIGRERKREIRAMLHRIVLKDFDDPHLMRCKGMLAFVISAEPRFLHSLIRAYGRDLVRSILRAPQISLYQDPTLIDLE